MAGHNRWTPIKRAKGVADARRGKLLSKLARELIVAAENGGGDSAVDARLFQLKGPLIVARDQADESGYEILKGPTAFEAVRRNLGLHQIPCEIAELTQLPLLVVPVEDALTASAARVLINQSDEHDDVKSVYHNAELPAET